MIRRSQVLSAGRFRASVLPAEPWNSWEEAEETLFADPDQRRRIGELVSDLSASGFDYPVTVGRDRWWELRPRVRDGVHRSIAAMRLGIDIPVRFGEPMMDGYDKYDEYTATVTAWDAETGNDDLMDRVFTLASFRSGDGFWMRCDTASGNADSGTFQLLLPRRAHRRGEIAAEFTDRLAAAGITAEVTYVCEV